MPCPGALASYTAWSGMDLVICQYLEISKFPLEPPQALAGQGLAVDNLFIDPWYYPINLVIKPGAGLRLKSPMTRIFQHSIFAPCLMKWQNPVRFARLAADDCLEALLLGGAQCPG